MKRTIFQTILLLTALPLAYGQTEIKLQLKNIRCDTVSIHAYNGEKKGHLVQTKPFAPELTFKNKARLEAGLYWVTGDSTVLCEFLLSPNESQKFTVYIDSDSVFFQNSAENTRNLEYVKRTGEYNRQFLALDQEFKEAQQTMPKYMLKVFADSLTAKARRLNAERAAWQRQMVLDNRNNLLGSVVQASIDMPEPPEEYYRNKDLYQKYYVQHFFDGFPWNDPNVFNTPVSDAKVKGFCDIIYQIDRPDLDTFVVDALDKAKTNEQSLYRLFDRMEKIIGSITSPYKVEHVYIKMLQNMLSYPKLDEDRRRRYERELKNINKNLAGDAVPDFRMVTATGDTISLYDIQSEYMILYLQHPTCPTCREVRGKMSRFPSLNSAIDNGNLKVLTVYFEDDPRVWEQYLRSPEANARYMHGWNFDQAIDDQMLYDTRTIPYMFLLDRNKRVVKKDLLANEIEDFIKRLGLD